MKTIRFFQAGAMMCLAALLLHTAAWAQPVVQVPPTCNVVVAGSGTGTAVGFGGVVGNGGIVIMPDPYSGDDFFLIPNATTVLGWSLAGDLSVQTSNLPPTPPIQFVPGAASPVNIQSYNNFLRPVENQPPSSGTLARSKGRVVLSYSSPGCNSSIQFDIYKEYPNTGSGSGYVPPIVGPECWLPDSIYTYSVDHIASDNIFAAIGADNYYWQIEDVNGFIYTPPSTTSYTSADNSSYTFQAPTSLADAPYTITCCFGRANPWDGNTLPFGSHTTCVTKVIGGQPTAPSISIPTCLNTGITSFSASVTAMPGYIYTWSSTNINWILTPSGPQGENLAVSAIGDQPGVIQLTISYGGCDPVTFTYPVEREFTAPMVITGPACVNAGSINNYTIPATALSNVTCWTLPTGWTYTNANGAGSSIDITVPGGTPAGAYTISAHSCACPAGVISYTVNVRPATPTIVAGPTCVTRNGGGPQVYTATSSPGASSYTWSIPAGWSCISCSGTTGILLPGGTGTGPENITVTAVGTNGCNATSAPYVVNYNPITPNSISVNCWNFGINGTTQLTVANAPAFYYGNYTVSITPAGLLDFYTVDPVTGVITLHTFGTAPAGTYTISISHTTASCGSSPVVNFSVPYAGNGASMMAFYDPNPTGSDVYIVSGAPGGATYSWYIDGLEEIGATASFLGLSGPSPGPVEVCAYVMSAGCTTVVCAPGGTHSRMAGPDGGLMEETHAVSVYPNPNNGTFIVDIPVLKNTGTLQLADSKGRILGNYKVREGNNRINTSDLAAGTYYLLLNLDGEATVHKVQIMKE